MKIIKAKNLRRTYHSGGNPIHAVDKVDLEVEPEEFIAIMGVSGAGKSTLLYQLGLLDRPTEGEIYIENQKTKNLTDKQRTYFRLKNLGFVFQDYALVPELTAIENVLITGLMEGKSKENIKKKSADILESVGLGDRLNNLPAELSGGEQQRVSLSRAIVNDPKILFADEPTASLDTQRSLEILSLFRKLNDEGQTIVMVTHEEEYAKFAERIVTLRDGKIISDQQNKEQRTENDI
ncbi:MAG: ABC transporter ATP-binding protein [Candidatus Magasanikbacteria bacterium]